jgi:hypothetical protein
MNNGITTTVLSLASGQRKIIWRGPDLAGWYIFHTPDLAPGAADIQLIG